MFYFKESTIEEIIDELDIDSSYMIDVIRKALNARHHTLYRDGKPYCIFFSYNSGYTHMEYFGENVYFPGEDYEEIGPILDHDKDFQEFWNNEWIQKEFEELHKRMYVYLGLHKNGEDCYIEFTHDPYWWEGYMIWKIMQSESNEIRRALKYKGKLPKISLGCGPSIKVEYRKK